MSFLSKDEAYKYIWKIIRKDETVENAENE
jgi:hypothetical protein